MDNKKFGTFIFVSLLIVIILIVLIMGNLNSKSSNTKPIIRLKGARYIEVNKGTNYVEPGYIAIDEKDGDITAKVVVEGNVNTKKEGVKEIITNLCG